MTPGEQQQAAPPPAAPRRQRVPYVSYAIIAASVAMFLFLDNALQSGQPPDQRVQPGILYGPWVQKGQYWRALSYAIEHGGLIHLAMNMYVVWVLGRVLESLIGSARFLLISVVTCLGSAAFVLWLGFKAPTVGASGMILGWAGAMLPILGREGRRSLWSGLLLPTALITVLPSLLRSTGGGAGLPQVSWQGHLGGFLFGVLCGLALRTGPRLFRKLGPLLVFFSAVAVVAAAHPEGLPR